MNIDEFKENLHVLGAEAVKKLGEFVSAQNNLFNEAKASQHGFIDMSLSDKVYEKEKEWQTASDKFFDWLRQGHEFFNRKS